MGLRVKATGNLSEVLASLDELEDRIRDVAMPRALNVLADQADVAGRRKIRDVYGISTADLAPYFDVTIASMSNPQASIVAKGKGFPLRVFNAVRTSTGARFKIKGHTVEVEHAFRPKGGPIDTTQWFARGRYGPGGPAAPKPRKGRRKRGLQAPGGGSVFRPSGEMWGDSFAYGLGRQPITLLRSASAPDALSNPEVIEAMNARVDEQAAKVLAREIAAVRRGY